MKLSCAKRNHWLAAPHTIEMLRDLLRHASSLAQPLQHAAVKRVRAGGQECMHNGSIQY